MHLCARWCTPAAWPREGGPGVHRVISPQLAQGATQHTSSAHACAVCSAAMAGIGICFEVEGPGQDGLPESFTLETLLEMGASILCATARAWCTAARFTTRQIDFPTNGPRFALLLLAARPLRPGASAGACGPPAEPCTCARGAGSRVRGGRVLLCRVQDLRPPALVKAAVDQNFQALRALLAKPDTNIDEAGFVRGRWEAGTAGRARSLSKRPCLYAAWYPAGLRDGAGCGGRDGLEEGPAGAAGGGGRHGGGRGHGEALVGGARRPQDRRDAWNVPGARASAARVPPSHICACVCTQRTGTPFLRACLFGQTAMATILLDRGANICAKLDVSDAVACVSRHRAKCQHCVPLLPSTHAHAGQRAVRAAGL